MLTQSINSNNAGGNSSTAQGSNTIHQATVVGAGKHINQAAAFGNNTNNNSRRAKSQIRGSTNVANSSSAIQGNVVNSNASQLMIHHP